MVQGTSDRARMKRWTRLRPDKNRTTMTMIRASIESDSTTTTRLTGTGISPLVIHTTMDGHTAILCSGIGAVTGETGILIVTALVMMALGTVIILMVSTLAIRTLSMVRMSRGTTRPETLAIGARVIIALGDTAQVQDHPWGRRRVSPLPPVDLVLEAAVLHRRRTGELQRHRPAVHQGHMHLVHKFDHARQPPRVGRDHRALQVRELHHREAAAARKAAIAVEVRLVAVGTQMLRHQATIELIPGHSVEAHRRILRATPRLHRTLRLHPPAQRQVLVAAVAVAEAKVQPVQVGINSSIEEEDVSHEVNPVNLA